MECLKVCMSLMQFPYVHTVLAHTLSELNPAFAREQSLNLLKKVNSH